MTKLRTARRFLLEVVKKSRIWRSEVKEKNVEKVKHLDRKPGSDCDILPSIIKKYSQAATFSDKLSDEIQDQQKPLVFGDIRVDEDDSRGGSGY